jgi:hypothetical protein
MLRNLSLGLLSGIGLVFFIRIISRDTLKNRTLKRSLFRRTGMTADEKLVKQAREIYETNPTVSTPGHEFLRDWAYGNAGLEDERITVEQVENVMSKRSA